MKVVLIGDIHVYRRWIPPWHLMGKTLLGQLNVWFNRKRRFNLSQMPPLLQKHTAPNSFSQLWMRSSQASTRVARMSTMPPSRHTTNWIPAHTAQPTTDTTDNHSRHVTPRPAAPPPSTPPCCTC